MTRWALLPSLNWFWLEVKQAAEERHSLILMALVDLATSGAAWESTRERREMLADGGSTTGWIGNEYLHFSAICQSLVAVNLLPPAYTTDALRGLRSSYYQVLIAQAKIVCRCTSKDDHILAANVGPGGGSEGKNAKTRTSSAYGTWTSTGWNFFILNGILSGDISQSLQGWIFLFIPWKACTNFCAKIFILK